MDTTIQVVGFASAVLTTGAFLPQAVKTWRTKSTDDLSPYMFAFFCTGIVGWLIYGILRSDLPMILANSITICLAGMIMFFIIRPDDTRKISHVALYVNDLETMKNFYVSVFQAKSSAKYNNQSTGFSSYFLSFSSGVRLELMHDTNRIARNNHESWGHIALAAGSKKAADRLFFSIESKDIEIITKPRLTGDGYYEFVISDPEKNRIEITI